MLMTNDRSISRRKNATNILIASCYDDSSLFQRPSRFLKGLCLILDRGSFRDDDDASRFVRVCRYRASIPVLWGSVRKTRYAILRKTDCLLLFFPQLAPVNLHICIMNYINDNSDNTRMNKLHCWFTFSINAA